MNAVKRKEIVDKVVLQFRVFCRVLRPPGGGSSNLFGGYEDDANGSRKSHKMASNIFGTPEQSESVPRRSNPPGQDSGLGQDLDLDWQLALNTCV